MYMNLFEKFGKYGGIGGISLGVFLVVGLQIIKSMRQRPGDESLKIFKMLAVLAWGLGVIGLFVWGWASHQVIPPPPVRSIDVKLIEGVAAGGDIKGSRIKVIPSPMKQNKGTATKIDGSKGDLGVMVEKGVAVGRNIEDSTITVNDKYKAK